MDAWRILQFGSSQWRAGIKSTPVEIKNKNGQTVKMLFRQDTKYIGLDFGAMIKMAEGMEIPITETLLEKISIFERASMAILNCASEDQRCSKEDKARCIEEYGQYLAWACKQCEKQSKEGMNG